MMHPTSNTVDVSEAAYAEASQSETPRVIEVPVCVEGDAFDWRRWKRVLTHTHTYSGKADHGGTVKPPSSYEAFQNWARRHGVDAVGMGSPYTPRSARTYGTYERERREEYYSGRIDQTALRDLDDIEEMLKTANAISLTQPRYYLDNETPKGRYGHMWWIHWHYDMPPWHDYDQPYDRWMTNPDRIEQFETEPMPYQRRPYREVVSIQRGRGAVGCWAHPTSWWWGPNNQFITNIATEMPAHAFADGFLDGMVIMGYGTWRPDYVDLWRTLLTMGIRVAGVAEMDMSISHNDLDQFRLVMLNLVETGGETGSDNFAEGIRRGRVTASSGPLLAITVDSAPMGSTTATSVNSSHTVNLYAQPASEGGLLDVELLGPDGNVLVRREAFGGGTLRLRIAGTSERSFVWARATAHGEPLRHKSPQVALSNPVYLHPPGTAFRQPMQSDLELAIADDSPWCGATVHFENADGDELGAEDVRSGVIRRTMPASGRITFRAPDGRTNTEYLINANPVLNELQRYLYRGRFHRDFADLTPGQVPVEAWRLNEYAAALAEVRLER